MKDKNNIIPSRSKQPFRVPDGYFENFEQQLKDRLIPEEMEQSSHETIITNNAGGAKSNSKISLRPYVALAASITGIALITYLLLQNISSSMPDDYTEYDIEMLNEAGIINDESIIAESYAEMEEDNYSDWDKDAMTYLASNEVELLILMDE